MTLINILTGIVLFILFLMLIGYVQNPITYTSQKPIFPTLANDIKYIQSYMAKQKKSQKISDVKDLQDNFIIKNKRTNMCLEIDPTTYGVSNDVLNKKCDIENPNQIFTKNKKFSSPENTLFIEHAQGFNNFNFCLTDDHKRNSKLIYDDCGSPDSRFNTTIHGNEIYFTNNNRCIERKNDKFYLNDCDFEKKNQMYIPYTV